MSKLICKNSIARHNYTILDTIETGIVLSGTEIKSIRNGKVNIKDSYANIKNGELFVYNLHISPYEHGNIYNKDPIRDRKLLVKKRELNKLIGLIKQNSYSLIPLSMYLKNSFIKIELGIGKGKKMYDKRRELAKKDAELKIQKALKEQQKRNSF